MNERLGIIEERQAWTNHVLSTARMSPAARARAMGKRYFQPPTVTWVTPEKPKPVEDAPPREMRTRRVKGERGKILNAVADAFNITLSEILDGRKTDRIARARFAAALFFRDGRNLSYPQIARAIKRRDHTSAMHEVARARELLATDPEWAERYHAAERLLKGER